MKKIVVIGPDSYLATGLQAHLSDCTVQSFYFHNWRENLAILQGADCVLNFSISPEFFKRALAPQEVIDVQLAEALKGFGVHYVFMSSRKVYGISEACLTHTETDPFLDTDFYAQNKIATERALQDILKDDVTILRISNIIGEPVLRTDYRTFMGWIGQNMSQKGFLSVTQNEHSLKDFITKDFLHQNLAAVIQKRATGIYNLSAGFATSVKDILTQYVGADKVHFLGTKAPLSDQFILDNSKLTTLTRIHLTPHELEAYLRTAQHQLYRLLLL